MESVSVMLTIPDELKALVAESAKEQNKSVSAVIREIIAAEMDYTIPINFGVRSKYASPEEAKEAREAKATAKKTFINSLLESYFAAHPDERAAHGF